MIISSSIIFNNYNYSFSNSNYLNISSILIHIIFDWTLILQKHKKIILYLKKSFIIYKSIQNKEKNMKIKLVLIILVFGFISKNAFAEDDVNMYKCQVQYYGSKNELYHYDGWFYGTDESSILISNSQWIEDYKNKNFKSEQINYNGIKYIKLRKKGRFLKHTIVGLCVGFASGIVMAIYSGDDKDGFFRFTTQDKMLLFGIPLGIIGGTIGLISGSKYETYPIHKDFGNFSKFKKTYEQYAIEKQMNNTQLNE